MVFSGDALFFFLEALDSTHPAIKRYWGNLWRCFRALLTWSVTEGEAWMEPNHGVSLADGVLCVIRVSDDVRSIDLLQVTHAVLDEEASVTTILTNSTCLKKEEFRGRELSVHRAPSQISEVQPFPTQSQIDDFPSCLSPLFQSES